MCDGVDHSGAVEDAGEHGGGEDHGDDRHDAGAVPGDGLLLLLDVREVDGQGDAGEDHEQYRDGDDVGAEDGQQGDSEAGIHPEELGTQGFPVGVEDAREGCVAVVVIRVRDGAAEVVVAGGGVVDTGRAGARRTRTADPTTPGRQPGSATGGDQHLFLGGEQRVPDLQLADSTTFEHAEVIGEEQHDDEGSRQRGDHRDEDIVGVDVQRTRGAGGGTAPRQDVHRAVGQSGDDGQHDRADTELQIERQQCGRRDDEGRRTVTVEGHDTGEYRGADHQPGRVVVHGADHRSDHRVEEPDVDHDAEEDDREEQHRRRRGEVLDAIGDHVADVETGTGEQAECDGDEDQRHDGRCPLGDDQHHEGGDHPEAECYQHCLARF